MRVNKLKQVAWSVSAFLALLPLVPGQNRQNTRQSRPLLLIRERLTYFQNPFSLHCPPGIVIPRLSYSQFEIFADGRGDQKDWSVPPCTQPHDKALSWSVPLSSKSREFLLASYDRERLLEVLNQPKALQLTDFMSDIYGAGDYEIEIDRPSGLQKIEVMGLSPTHDELRRDPTLLRLICVAKQVAGDDRPSWCPAEQDYLLDESPGEFALYPGPSIRSFVSSKYVVRSLGELERRVGALPPGTKLSWYPLKRDASGKPILFSDDGYSQFAEFCRDYKIELLVAPIQPTNGKSD